MSFPGDNIMENYENVRSYSTRGSTVRQAYDEGKIVFNL